MKRIQITIAFLFLFFARKNFDLGDKCPSAILEEGYVWHINIIIVGKDIRKIGEGSSNKFLRNHFVCGLNQMKNQRRK